MQKGNMNGKAYRGSDVSFGEFGLKAMEPGWITSRQIEAARIAINRHVKRGCKVWIRIFPDKPITKKPAETRMGKGKGALEYWVAVVKPGRIIYEMSGVTEDVAKEALRLASHKLPLSMRFVKREEKRTMKAAELRETTVEELQEERTGSEKELFNLRFQQATGEIENPMRIRAIKKNIAKILTVITEKNKPKAS